MIERWNLKKEENLLNFIINQIFSHYLNNFFKEFIKISSEEIAKNLFGFLSSPIYTGSCGLNYIGTKSEKIQDVSSFQMLGNEGGAYKWC